MKASALQDVLHKQPNIFQMKTIVHFDLYKLDLQWNEWLAYQLVLELLYEDDCGYCSAFVRSETVFFKK